MFYILSDFKMPVTFIQTVMPRQIFLLKKPKPTKASAKSGGVFGTLRMMHLQYIPDYLLYIALICNIPEYIAV